MFKILNSMFYPDIVSLISSFMEISKEDVMINKAILTKHINVSRKKEYYGYDRSDTPLINFLIKEHINKDIVVKQWYEYKDVVQSNGLIFKMRRLVQTHKHYRNKVPFRFHYTKKKIGEKIKMINKYIDA